MIQSHFGLEKLPFDQDPPRLLDQQRRIFEMLLIHARQGGLCLVLGDPGTGKSLIKRTLAGHDQKRMVTPLVNRTLHSYHNTLRILCEAFEIDYDGRDCKCERHLVNEALRLHRSGKALVPIIDDAHLMPAESLRKLRLLMEDFPASHNLVLIGQPALMHTLSLSVNEEIRSRVTYSQILHRLAPDDMTDFITRQLQAAGLGANIFTDDAMALIVRSSDGVLRLARNLAIGALVEAVRDQTRTVDLAQVNNVLRQPHYRRDFDVNPI